MARLQCYCMVGFSIYDYRHAVRKWQGASGQKHSLSHCQINMHSFSNRDVWRRRCVEFALITTPAYVHQSLTQPISSVHLKVLQQSRRWRQRALACSSTQQCMYTCYYTISTLHSSSSPYFSLTYLPPESSCTCYWYGTSHVLLRWL